ncbi:TonB-dependent receptor [Microbulbifer thermotolerans]|uniref:TonB-dependent receptor n=1 Tax=Microbulbifer thermotolerans TaxID=252514 RepID=A0AB35HXY6_MICTH|nr:TonB-dependent receptor [Microbulbifer thermotolerans]MCX2782252.1 TonB-dependent receptor [Microbulbifer thermotolerans]MCX2802422.1 TonB-dependent receptor [Microbulbifer thermotolerans]MCX2836059.1 TonB-dependent receptor [Microbulbifer thermotolerans]
MSNQFGFRKKSMAAAIAAMTMSSVTIAQSQETPALEEVTVLGVRGAQESAVNLKRDSLSMVDGIVAEDIGKLPDVTVVDSLQRISGVQIKRDAGEGATANIRGLPQVMTLLNGEQYLTAGNLGGAQPTLTDIPSQLMGGVNVYKSADLSNALNGITGTLDLRTLRPMGLDEGFTSTVAAEMAQGDYTGETDPSVNGLVSWRNETMGVLFSASKSEANLGNNYSGISGGVFGNNDWGGDGKNFNAPHGYDSFNRVVERNRTGMNLAFEADLGNGFNVVAEGFYTELEEHNRAVGLNISNRWQTLDWLTPTDYTDTGIAGNNGESWLSVDEYDVHAQWVNSFTVNRTNTSDSKNINLELNYDNGGNFRGGLRAIHGDANRLSMNGQAQGDLSNWRDDTPKQLLPFYPADIAALYDEDRYVGDVGENGGRFIDPNPLGYGETPELHYDISGSHPRWSGFDNPISGGLGAGATMRDYMANLDSYAVAAFSSEGNNESDATLDVFSAKGSYDFDQAVGGFITKVDFGLRRSDRQVEIEQFHLFSRFYAGNGATDPAGCEAQWKAIDVVMDQDQCQAGELVNGEFQGYTVNRPTKLYDYNNVIFVDDYGSVTSGLPGVWAIDPKDFDDVEAFQKRVFGDAYRVIVPGESYDVGLVENSFTLSADFEYGIVTGNLGLRVIDTEISVRQNVTGDIKNYGDTNIDAGDVFSKNSYTDVLPALNLTAAPYDELLLRFAASQNMMPLDLGWYGGGLDINTSDCPEYGYGTRCVTSANAGGNPELDPWRSTNFDVAVEYYFGGASMANLALFHVDIDSFVVGGTVEMREFADSDGVVRRSVPVTGPVEGEGGKVQGVELGAKLAFGDFTDGLLGNFGIDTNYTYSPSSSNDVDKKGNELPFYDTSEHQFNFVAWYQDEKLQARIAYNYRSDRLQDGNVGGTGFQVYQEATNYVDAQVSYDVTEEVTVFLNGSNITGEIENYYIDYAGEAEQYHSQNEFEPRYTLGVRARF